MSRLPNKHVASGSFEVFKSRQQVLEAFLGTCVGVGIVDKKAGVGGLYHILLPEHTADSEPLSHETYANTGMPRFLEALCEAGGDPSTMEATLAGGALMGTISRLDLQLDLGGRTVEIVHQRLKEAGIPVVQSQTGGFFGAKLIVDLLTLNCQIAPAHLELQTDTASIVKPTPQELDRAIANIQPIPQVALKIIRTMQTEDYGLGDIAREIRHDQVISAHVIRMCNSAYVSPQIEIESIDHAILILGTQVVFQFVLSSVMSNFFESIHRGYSMSKGGLYHHAVSTAIVSEKISKLLGHDAPDTAYTAGLLHDIGKVLLDQFIASARPFFYGKIISEGAHLVDVERSEFGITHVEAGMRLAELWDFPSSLQDAIAYHDQPELAQHSKDLAHVVHLADLLMSRFNTGYELEGINTEGLPAHLHHLGLNSSSLPELIAQIPWKFLGTPGYF